MPPSTNKALLIVRSTSLTKLTVQERTILTVPVARPQARFSLLKKSGYANDPKHGLMGKSLPDISRGGMTPPQRIRICKFLAAAAINSCVFQG
jgi:hypothetical protein